MHAPSWSGEAEENRLDKQFRIEKDQILTFSPGKHENVRGLWFGFPSQYNALSQADFTSAQFSYVFLSLSLYSD